MSQSRRPTASGTVRAWVEPVAALVGAGLAAASLLVSIQANDNAKAAQASADRLTAEQNSIASAGLDQQLQAARIEAAEDANYVSISSPATGQYALELSITNASRSPIPTADILISGCQLDDMTTPTPEYCKYVDGRRTAHIGSLPACTTTTFMLNSPGTTVTAAILEWTSDSGARWKAFESTQGQSRGDALYLGDTDSASSPRAIGPEIPVISAPRDNSLFLTPFSTMSTTSGECA